MAFSSEDHDVLFKYVILPGNTSLTSYQGSRLDSKQLPSVRSLGKGLSGFIYETTWLGKRYARKDFPLGSEKRSHVFEEEAKTLLKIDHPNTVKCFGYTVGKSSCSLLQDYLDHDLQSTIQRRIEAQHLNSLDSTEFRSRVLGDEEMKRLLPRRVKKESAAFSKLAGSRNYTSHFEIPEAVHIILQIAIAMKHLHENQVAHGDLKPKNVLLYSDSGNMSVKVADFGLAGTKRLIKLASKRRRHLEILTWKAPEFLKELLGPATEDLDDPFTDSDTDSDEEIERFGDFRKSRLAMADVYSFGLTCSYILGGKLSYPELSLNQLREQRMQGFEPELPSTCPEHLESMIQLCLRSKPLSRPTFYAICTMLVNSPRILDGLII